MGTISARTRLLVVGAVAACAFAGGVHAGEVSVTLSAYPAGAFRWLDVAKNLYSAAYRVSFSYTQAVVRITFASRAPRLSGTLMAANLKPNFAYHVLWGDWQRAPSTNDGPMARHTFDPDPALHPCLRRRARLSGDLFQRPASARRRPALRLARSQRDMTKGIHASRMDSRCHRAPRNHPRHIP